MPEQREAQLKWSDSEIGRIGNRVMLDYRAAINDHNRRIGKWREYYRRWRATVDIPQLGEEQKSNLQVPYIRWNMLTKLAKEIDSLLGDDAEIVAVPVGPSDAKRVHKVGKYMSWLVFNSMRLVNPLCAFITRKLLFGRSVAYSPWRRDTFDVDGNEVVDFEGPGFDPLWPDDVIVPAEDVQSIQDFSFVVRRYRVTPDQLLRGEEEGRYQGISKNWQTLVGLAKQGIRREAAGEEIKSERDEAEGILYCNPASSGEWLTIIEWYGRWRPLKNRKKDASEWDFNGRERKQHDFVVRYLLDLNIVIGVQDLEALYPTIKNRRPFVESSFIKDGSYWSPGMAEMLIDIEDEIRKNHNLATDAQELAVGPIIFYRPASGFDPNDFKYEPKMAIAVDNPSADVKVVEVGANLEAASWKEQTCQAYGEQLTGLSQMSMGRQSDRPNAPRTARQTIALLEEGNVRISLDATVLREDMAAILKHFWELEFMFAPDEVFFRVTDDDAAGLFPTQNGGSIMTQEDRDGRYDFRLNFANSVYSREAGKERTLARYQIDMQNPLIVQNPLALWTVTKAVHEALGDDDFESMVPKPPVPDLPVDPKTEWSLMLEGEDVHVNPQDNDQQHLIRHAKDKQMAQKTPHMDPAALRALDVHIDQQIAQFYQKQFTQAVMEQAVGAAAKLAQGGGAAPGGAPPGQPFGLFGGTPTVPGQNPVEQNITPFDHQPRAEGQP